MNYIKYWNDVANRIDDGYVVKKEQHFLYVCPVLAYHWMKAIDQFSLLSTVELVKIPKNELFIVEEEDALFFDDWVFFFELAPEKHADFHHYVHFFDCFLAHPTLPIGKRLEHCIDTVYPSLDKKTIQALLEFCLSYHEKPAYSAKLQKFLQPTETIIFQFIEFHDSFSERGTQGFLLKEDEDFFYVIHPLLYQWLRKNNQLDFLDKITPFRYKKHQFSYRLKEEPLTEPWILAYPFQAAEVTDMNGIIYFFDTFLAYQDFPFIKRVEICTRHKRFPISTNTMNKLVQYIATHYKEERIRMLMSEQLGPFLR